MRCVGGRVPLLGVAWAILVACQPHTPPATGSKQASAALTWEALAKESEPALGAPPSLKTDDGRVVRLRSVKVRAQVILPVAFTELELGFDDIPGESATFSLDLPAAAAVSRFAVHDQGGFHDAEPFGPEQAQTAFAPVQPILERQGDGPQNFSARVLAQPGQKPRLLVAYATRLTNVDTPYRVRLAGVPRLDELDVTVQVGGGKSPRLVRFARAGFAPDRDFSLAADRLGDAGDFLALRAGKYGVLRVLPETTRATNMTFLVDTSASQPVSLERISDFLLSVSETIAKQPSPPLLTVVGFDQSIVPIVTRARAPLSREQLAPLVARGRLGGTDLYNAVSSLITQRLPRQQIVWLSDFENSIRPVQDDYLGHDDEQERSDSLVADAAAEKSLLLKYKSRLVYKPEQPGVIARMDDDPSRVARLLLQPTPVKTDLRIKGASWTSAPDDEEAPLRAWTPDIGQAIWAAAEYEDAAPLQVIDNGKARPPVAPVNDQALAMLLKQVVGGARVGALLARLAGYGFSEPAEAARGLDELAQLSKDYGLLSPLSSFVVPSGTSGGKPRYLAGRAIDVSRTRLVTSTSVGEAPAPASAPPKCPELIGLSSEQRNDAGCPPLFVDFREGRVRLIAEVSFAGAGTPLAQVSPHLDELVEVLTLRPELAKLTVSAPSKAQADGVVRYLVQRGIAAGRFETERLLEGVLPPRKARPKCKSAAQRVLLEVRKMSLDHINQAVVRKPVLPGKQSEPSRLSKIKALIRSGWSSERAEEIRSEAVRLSEAWVRDEPKNPLAYVALGESQRDRDASARAYGSLFDLHAPGSGLDLAGALRFQQLGIGSRWWGLAMGTFRQRWQDGVTGQARRGDVEGSRAHSYAALSASQGHRRGDQPLYATDSSLIFEAAERSVVVAQIEAPVFAHARLLDDPGARYYLEGALARQCWFPMKGSVLGAVLSWEDPDADLEISVTATKAGFTYDSVLTERAPGVTLKWLPLPEKSDDYPITVSVRAQRLGKSGYAFGVVRELDYTGRGRVSLEQKPFVVSQVGESIPVYEQVILQRPQ